ncbi:MAG: ComEC family competence protein [Candidatus Moranbacteria bacterium]|nr:ComEC family competence protein [Candidatus Moranbacteria bacterium]
MNITKSKIFLVLFLSFIGGVFWASFFDAGIIFVLVLLIFAIIVFSLSHRNKIVLTAAFAVLFFALGIWKMNDSVSVLDELEWNERDISSRAIIIKEPEMKEKYQKVIVRFENEDELGIGKVLLRADLFDELEYGDVLDLNCKLEVPKNFSDDFDYRMYLAKDKIHYLCQNPSFKKTGENSGNILYHWILKGRKKCEEKIDTLIPAPGAALANGLLFGGDDRLSKSMQEKFSKTGMTHIVAVSGYNVTIIAEYLIFLGIFLGLWRKQAFYAAVAGILLFVVMIGLPSSGIRAGIMGTLLLWAAKNGRIASAYNAIICAGGIMVFANPLLLRWDIGFQLSFLAALGIIATGSFWEEFFIKKFRAFGFTEVVCMTVSAQIFVLPIILFNFKIFSVVSLFANLLILTIIPITMLLVFLTVVFGFIFPPLAVIFSWIAHIFLRYEVGVIDWLSGFSWASTEVSSFSWPWIVVWYAVLTYAVVKMNKYLKEREEE